LRILKVEVFGLGRVFRIAKTRVAERIFEVSLEVEEEWEGQD
jgi:hypothetical protein